MNTTPPTECKAWQDLVHHAESWRGVHLRSLFEQDLARGSQLAAAGPGVRYDYSRQRMGAVTLRLLVRLAAERGFAEWREALLTGKPINNTENRPAWHTALRASNPPTEVRETLQRAEALAARVRGEKRYKRVVNLGTGGSDLGPRLLADALDDGSLDVRFAANIDPKDLERALDGADPASTLIVVVSKTFTTQETMANAQAAKAWGAKDFIAVTANVALARQFGAQEIFPMWDWVGGRFSVWSAVGFAAMCAIGPGAFREFLNGGRDVDEHFAQAPLEKNLPVLMALVGAWNTNFLGIPTHAVLPYSNALRLLPSYLQQLEMESNGKRVDREGRAVAYATAPVLFGAEGTVSQHSFHQLLHQGTQAVACDFIELGRDRSLAANCRAQADALAFGTDDPSLPPHRQYPGNRPSGMLIFENFNSRTLGRLIALYEHKVFTQGVIWNINSFDQWGVELGKELANRILKGER
jgi:glucose-6-phosphate isomerase